MALFDDVLKELQSRATVRGPDSNGDYVTFCPFHQDKKHPNLFIHPQKGVHCFACDAKGSIKTLATKLGIPTDHQTTKSNRLSPSEAIQKLLNERRLRPETLKHFGIDTDTRRQAWKYPVNGGFRYKAYSANAKRKYWHDKGVKNQLCGLADIADGTGEIWLVNGEPVIWQCWQVKVPAVCGIYGEGILPDDIVDKLKAKGVKRVDVSFDLDSTGERGGKIAWSKLRHEFEVVVHILPSELGEGGDVGDLFVRCDGDNNKFREELRSLPQADTEGWEDEALKAQIDLIRNDADTPVFEQRRIISQLKPRGFSLSLAPAVIFGSMWA